MVITMNWKRARTDDRKNERKEEIYNAAFELFKKNGYEKVSFNGIASEAGFTKSNMYRYFSSKEDIFLNVFAELFEQWFEDCIASLQQLESGADVKRFADAYVQSFLLHPKFLDLTPILFVSLEKNSSYEQLLIFKRQAKGLLFQIAMEVCRIYPELEIDKAFRFLTLSYAATSNFWAANQQNDALRKIYEQEEFQDLKPDFEQDLTASVEVIIHGLKACQ